MAICKFFLEGRCRFGENCKNEHPRDQNQANRFAPLGQGGGGGGRGRAGGFGGDRYRPGQDQPSHNNPHHPHHPNNPTQPLPYHLNPDSIRLDLTAGGPTGEKPAWPLSCYGPGRDAPRQLLEGLIEQSPEECRVLYYQAVAAGAEREYIANETNAVNTATQQAQTILSDLDGAIKYVIDGRDHHPNRLDQVVTTHPNPNPNPSLASQPSAFGGQQPQQSTASPFGGGGGGGGATTGGFGQPSALGAGGSGSAFGRPSGFGAAAGGAGGATAFGQPSQPGSGGGAGASAFGAPSALGAGKPAFGQPSQPAGGAAFGQASQPGAGGSAFGAPSALGGSQAAFGQASRPGGGSAFGAPSALGGGGGAGAFGQPSQPGSSAFGVPSALGGNRASPFASAGQPSAFGGGGGGSGSGFGKPAFGQASSPFGGASQQQPQQQQTPQNPFGSGGGGAAAQASPFAAAAAAGQQTSSFGAAAGQGQQQSANPFASASGPSGGSGSGGAQAGPNPFAAKQPAATGFGQPAQPAPTPSAPTQTPSAPTITQPTHPPPPHPSGLDFLSPPTTTPGWGNALGAQGMPPAPQLPPAPFPTGPAATAAYTTRFPDHTLQTFKQQPVTYDSAAHPPTPVYPNPLSGRKERIWFPDGPPAALNRYAEAPERVYEDLKAGRGKGGAVDLLTVLRGVYERVNETGMFPAEVREGCMPEVPPRREWLRWDL